MPALLEAPQTTRTPKGPRWTREQAAQAAAKSLQVRRQNSVKRKQEAKRDAELFLKLCSADPITDVERALSVAAKHGKAKSVEHLSLALSRLKASEAKPSRSYTTTPSSSLRQPTPSIPQSTHAVDPKPVEHGANFAQYTEPLVQGQKESLLSAGVGAMPGVGAAVGQGGGSVIEHITHSPVLPGEDSGLSLEQEIHALESRLTMLRAQQARAVDIGTNPVITQSAGGHLRGGLVENVKAEVGVEPVQSHEGMEKFLVGGVWIWGRRKK